jgi:CRP/FNR family cyclic AMP-dependent transcriptional regulator
MWVSGSSRRLLHSCHEAAIASPSPVTVEAPTMATRGMAASLSRVSLPEVLPELVAEIPKSDRDLALEVLSVPAVYASDQRLDEILASMPTAFDFIIAEGIVLKQTSYAGRQALELYAPGDVLAPPLTASRQIESPAISSYRAHGDVLLAVLEHRFRVAARRWPGLSDVFHDHLARQTHRASMRLARLHLSRSEDRVLALFSDLAERFGRVTPNGIVIDLDLTHDLIGQMVASRRPTVSLALDQLAHAGQLTRTDTGQWNLNPDALFQ